MTKFERLLSIFTKLWAISIGFGLFFLSYLYLDRPIAYYFHNLDLKNNLPFLNKLSNLGLSELYLVPLLAMAIFFRYIYPKHAWEKACWFLWLCVFFTRISCIALKMLIGRARPDLLFSAHSYGFYGLQTKQQFWSCPSGHTTVIMSLAFGVSALFPHYLWISICTGLLLSLTRVLLTQHYLSDIFAASYLALVEVGILYYYFRARCLKPHRIR